MAPKIDPRTHPRDRRFGSPSFAAEVKRSSTSKKVFSAQISDVQCPALPYEPLMQMFPVANVQTLVANHSHVVHSQLSTVVSERTVYDSSLSFGTVW